MPGRAACSCWAPTSWAATCSSRILAGSRVSLTIGLVGVLISFVLGCLLGGISGYFGGVPDLIIQRLNRGLQLDSRHSAVDGAKRGHPP